MIYDITTLFFNIFLIITLICLSIVVVFTTIYYLLVYLYPRIGYGLRLYFDSVKEADSE